MCNFGSFSVSPFFIMSIVDDILGSLLIGMLVACVLYGATTVQMYVYYQNYENDQLVLKSTVGTLWIMETIHTMFCMQFTYAYLITHFGDLAFMGEIYWSGGITVLLGIIIATVVQCFYVWRVWIVSRKTLPITLFVAFFGITRMGFGIATSVFVWTIPQWAIFRIRRAPLVTISTGLAAAAFVDVLVALCLIFYLRRSRSGHLSVNLLNSIIIYTVNTGALTSIISVLSVILFATEPHSLAFLALTTIQSKLYSVSFLGSLNARQRIRNNMQSSPQVFPSVEFSDRNTMPATSPQIEVFRQTVVMTDTTDDDMAVKTLNLGNNLKYGKRGLV